MSESYAIGERVVFVVLNPAFSGFDGRACTIRSGLEQCPCGCERKAYLIEFDDGFRTRSQPEGLRKFHWTDFDDSPNAAVRWSSVREWQPRPNWQRKGER